MGSPHSSTPQLLFGSKRYSAKSCLAHAVEVEPRRAVGKRPRHPAPEGVVGEDGGVVELGEAIEGVVGEGLSRYRSQEPERQPAGGPPVGLTLIFFKQLLAIALPLGKRFGTICIGPE